MVWMDGNRSSTRTLLVVTVVFCAGLSTALVVSGAATYTLNVSNTVDGPEQEYTVEGETYTVSSLSYVEPGDPIEASVSRSTDDGPEYELLLYNTDKQIEKNTRPQTGNATLTFATDDLPAGSYLLVVEADDVQAYQPIIVQGYDVALQTQTTVGTGNSFTATATLDPYADAPEIRSVEFVILGEETEEHFRATRTDTGAYESTIRAPDTGGSYSFGVIVNGTTEVQDGRYEPIAISDPVTLEVQPDGTGGPATETASTPATSATATDVSESDGPITPAEGSEDGLRSDEGDSTTDGQSGFGFSAALATILVVIALLFRRR